MGSLPPEMRVLDALHFQDGVSGESTKVKQIHNVLTLLLLDLRFPPPSPSVFLRR